MRIYEAFNNTNLRICAEQIKAWRDLYNELKKSNSNLLEQIPELKEIEDALKIFENKMAVYRKEEYRIRAGNTPTNLSKYMRDAQGNYFEIVNRGRGLEAGKRVNRDILLDHQKELQYRDQFAPKVFSEMTVLENKMATLAPAVDKLLTLSQEDPKLSQLSQLSQLSKCIKDILNLPKSLKENVQADLSNVNQELEMSFLKEWSKANALMRLGKRITGNLDPTYIEGETAAWDENSETRKAWFVQKSQQLSKLKGDPSFRLEYLKPVSDKQHEDLQYANKVNIYKKVEKIDVETAFYIEEHIREIVPYEEQIELREKNENFRALDNEVLLMDAMRWHKYQEIAKTKGIHAAEDYYMGDDPEYPDFWAKMNERDDQLMKFMGLIPMENTATKEETEKEKEERLKSEMAAEKIQMYLPEELFGPNPDAPVEQKKKEPEISPEEIARLEQEEQESLRIRGEEDYPPELRALFMQELEALYQNISLPECTEDSPEIQNIVNNTKQHLDKIKSCTNGYDFAVAMTEMCNPDGEYTASVNKMLEDTAQKSSLSDPERDRAKMLLGMRQFFINFLDGIDDPAAFTERRILGNAMADKALEMLKDIAPSVHSAGVNLLKDPKYYEQTAAGILYCEDFQELLEQKNIIPEKFHGETHRNGREKLNSEQAFILDAHFITDRINNVPRSFVPQSKEQSNILPAQEATFTAVRINRPILPKTENAPDCKAYLDEMNRLWGDMKKTDFFLMRNSREFNALRDYLKEVMPKLNNAADSDHIAQDLAQEMQKLTPLINAYRDSHAPNDFSDRQMRRLKIMNRMERLAQSFENQVSDPKADVEGMFAEKFIQNDAIRKLQGGNTEEKQYCRDILLGKTLSQEVNSFYEEGKPGAFIKGQLDATNMVSLLRRNGLSMLQDMMKTNIYQSAMQAGKQVSAPVPEEPEIKTEGKAVEQEGNQPGAQIKTEGNRTGAQIEAEGSQLEARIEAANRPEAQDDMLTDEDLETRSEKYIDPSTIKHDTARNLDDFFESHPEAAQEMIDRFRALSDEFARSAEKGKPVSEEFAKVQVAFLKKIKTLEEAKDSPSFGDTADSVISNMNRAFARYRAKLEGTELTPAEMKQMEIMCRTDRLRGKLETGFGKLHDFLLEKNAGPENEVNPDEQAKESLAAIRESMEDYAQSDASEDASPEFKKLQEYLEEIIPELEARQDSPEFYKDMMIAMKKLSPLVAEAKVQFEPDSDRTPAQGSQFLMLEEIRGEIDDFNDNLRSVKIDSEEMSNAARNELKERFAERFVLAVAMRRLMKDPGDERAKKTLTGETLQKDIDRFRKSPLMQDSFIEKNQKLIEKAVALGGLEMASQIIQRFGNPEKKPAEAREDKKNMPSKQNESRIAQNTNASIGSHI